jgi:hypothetical protein
MGAVRKVSLPACRPPTSNCSVSTANSATVLSPTNWSVDSVSTAAGRAPVLAGVIAPAAIVGAG